MTDIFRSLLLVLALGLLPAVAAAEQCVVLLHGLARTSGSMAKMAGALAEAGFTVSNIGYPSRDRPVEELAAPAINKGLAGCGNEVAQVHFVTHSMGGILVRYYLKNNNLPELGRVVMLAPPNQGSELVDNLRDIPGFDLIYGPAGRELGTREDSLVRGLGPVDFDLGVIAGTRSYNPIFGQFLPEPHDGKVSVESTRVEGMRDFLSVPYSHTFIMRKEPVIAQVIEFFRAGSFDHQSSEPE